MITIEYENPRTSANHGQLFLNGKFLGYVWQNPRDWGKIGGMWVFNRDQLAFDLGIPQWDPYTTVEGLIQSLESWLKQNGKEF